jgi:hypothetical protein
MQAGVCHQHTTGTTTTSVSEIPTCMAECTYVPCGVLPAGLTAHSQPGVAFPILVAIIVCQGLCLGLAAAYRPFISAFLNFLEVTCGALDIATLVITAIVYKHKQERQAAGAVQGKGDAGFAKVGRQLRQSSVSSRPATNSQRPGMLAPCNLCGNADRMHPAGAGICWQTVSIPHCTHALP